MAINRGVVGRSKYCQARYAPDHDPFDPQNVERGDRDMRGEVGIDHEQGRREPGRPCAMDAPAPGKDNAEEAHEQNRVPECDADRDCLRSPRHVVEPVVPGRAPFHQIGYKQGQRHDALAERRVVELELRFGEAAGKKDEPAFQVVCVVDRLTVCLCNRIGTR